MSSPPTTNSGGAEREEDGRFPEIGDVFLDKYEIEGLLGKGGYAKVYRATQIELGRSVAIKVLSPNVQNIEASENNTGSVEALAVRFEREAKLVSRLRSPYTVTMYDYGQTPQDLLYMVLEYIDGITLDEESFPIEPARISKILRQVLKSLQEAHAEGLLHRDLKPANIMLYEHLGERDQVKLLDFGIAKLIGERHADQVRNEADLTGDATLLGTPRYMAPEQIRGEEVGPPRDIYSLGLIAYEMLVGEKAIEESDSIKIMAKHISAEPLQVPVDAGHDPRLSRIIDRMLAKRVEDRYATVEAVIEDLKEYERQLEAETAPEPSGSGLAPESEAESESEESRVGLALLVGAILGVGALGFLFATGRFQADREGAPRTIESGRTAPADRAGRDADPAATAADVPDTVDDTGHGVDSGDTEVVDANDAAAVAEISSTPAGATIYLGERELGVTPLQLPAGSVEFPATLRAELDGRTREQTLESTDSSVQFEFDEAEETPQPEIPPSARTEESMPGERGGRSADDEEPPAGGSTPSNRGEAASEDADETAGGEATGAPGTTDEPASRAGDDNDEPDEQKDEKSDDAPVFLPVE